MGKNGTFEVPVRRDIQGIERSTVYVEAGSWDEAVANALAYANSSEWPKPRLYDRDPWIKFRDEWELDHTAADRS